jgi:hypothetical protein
MENAEDKHIGLARAIQEPERVYKKLPNVRLSVLRYRCPALTEECERIGRAENAL